MMLCSGNITFVWDGAPQHLGVYIHVYDAGFLLHHTTRIHWFHFCQPARCELTKDLHWGALSRLPRKPRPLSSGSCIPENITGSVP